MSHHRYFVRKRARFITSEGKHVNIPYGTICDGDGVRHIFYKGKLLCRVESQNAIDFFVQDDDGCGRKRAELVNLIIDTLESKDDMYQKRWDRIWNDSFCKPYKKSNHPDNWHWTRDFYDAPIFILEHILGLVKKGE